MGRAPCCDKANVKKGPWSPEEDTKLKDYIEKYGTGGNWIALPQKAGLRRCGKSCRLRWLNYLRPNIKHGEFTEEEDRVICSLYVAIGSRWSIIAAQLPGRTDNDIKNYWNTKLKKKLMGLVPNSHKKPPLFPSSKETTTSSSSSLSALYKDYNPCYIPTKSFLGLESSFSSNLLSSNSNYMGPAASSFLHSDDSLNMCSSSPMQQYFNYHTKDTAFAIGSEGSCSSSDGSCSQISSREMKQGDHIHNMGYQYHSYNISNNFTNGFYQESQKLVHGVDQGGFLDQTPLEYDLENVKNQTCSGNLLLGASCESFVFNNNGEENKSTSQEKIMSMMYNYY